MKTTLEKMAVMAEAVQNKQISFTRLVDGAKFYSCASPDWNWVDYDYDVMVEAAECWVWIHPDGSYGHGFNNEQKAKVFYHDASGRAVLMREAIE